MAIFLLNKVNMIYISKMIKNIMSYKTIYFLRIGK